MTNDDFRNNAMDLLTELIDCFLDTAPDRLEELRLGTVKGEEHLVEGLRAGADEQQVAGRCAL